LHFITITTIPYYFRISFFLGSRIQSAWRRIGERKKNPKNLRSAVLGFFTRVQPRLMEELSAMAQVPFFLVRSLLLLAFRFTSFLLPL
jgi:hypothetical protein